MIQEIGKLYHFFFLSIIQRGIAQGYFRQEISPEVALRSVFILHSAAVRTEQFKKFRFSANKLLLHTTAVYIRGLCTGEGLQALDEHIKNSWFIEGAEIAKSRIKKVSTIRR